MHSLILKYYFGIFLLLTTLLPFGNVAGACADEIDVIETVQQGVEAYFYNELNFPELPTQKEIPNEGEGEEIDDTEENKEESFSEEVIVKPIKKSFKAKGSILNKILDVPSNFYIQATFLGKRLVPLFKSYQHSYKHNKTALVLFCVFRC